MSYNVLRVIDTPMKAAKRLKLSPGRYQCVASFPSKDLHSCKDGVVPEEVELAPTRDRVAQIDLVGPRGQIIRSCQLDIADFVAWTDETRGEMVRFESEFAKAVGLPSANLVQQYQQILQVDLARDLMDDRDFGVNV